MSANSIAPASTPQQVLDFWFALPSPGQKDDPLVRAALGEVYERAAAHKLDAWAEAPRERLALILLVDQVPRHLYREDARAYATDLKAQTLAGRFFVQQDRDRRDRLRRDWTDFAPRERFHAALPYLHAEDAAKQRLVNPVIHQCAAQIKGLEFMGRIADLYLETIERFGYFPHRNPMRGRESTAEELRFVAEVWNVRRRRDAPATG